MRRLRDSGFDAALRTARGSDPGLPDHLWTTAEAARFLRLSTKTLRRLVTYHDLPCVRLGARLRFIPADVLAWARHRTEA